jgi:5-formyltetrahydrofolate cyclo-ligase
VPVDKASLRIVMRALGPVPGGVGDAIGARLFPFLSARLPATISAFIAMEGEVDLRPLMARLPGWRWVLPRVEPDRSLTFRDAAVPREKHPFGMEQPVDSGPVIPIHEIDVFLVPGLAFDLRGGRLGNGAGHYDRVLAAARSDAVSIGICAPGHLVESVPTDKGDLPVDYIATEEGVIPRSPKT